MKVPFFELTHQNLYLNNVLSKAFDEVLKSGSFILSKNVQAFEEKLAACTGADYAVGTASGTDALILSLMAHDIGKGDEVITSPFTFFATASSIARVGAVPVFVDIDPSTFNVRPELVEKAVTPRTKAIIAVHLFGLCADMKNLNKIARKNNLVVIEDAAQSIGAAVQDIHAGNLGACGAFSFFPTKNLGCCGDGGAVTTNSTEVCQRLKRLRVHGSKDKYIHTEIGINSRLDEVQAALLNAKISYLQQWTDRRRKLAIKYNEALKAFPDFVLPVEPEGYFHVYNQYTIRTEKRDKLKEALASANIATAVYYPLPLHLQPCFAYLGYTKGSLPEAEKAAQQVLSLPVYPELTQEMQEYTIEKIIHSQVLLYA